MGRLIDGDWQTEETLEHSDEGRFQRQETTFRDRIRPDPAAEFPAEPGRYHLYVSRACPWAHRTTLVRQLKGLADVISLDVVDPVRIDQGWEFTPEKDDCTPETVNGADYLRDVYTAADPEYTGRVTVPVLWDKERGTIVNNESEEIIKMLDTAFDEYATRDLTLYPEDRRDEIDRLIDEIYNPINNGVYRAGFAGTQDAYETAVGELFDALDRWESVLDDQRYLAGDQLTLADVCLFPTLYRFDSVYHTHFKCNVRRIADYPNLRNYLRELYQLPGVAATCNMEHVKEHYYRSHDDINPSGLVAVGPDEEFDEEHDRDRLTGGPPAALVEPAD
ncbi:MAG: putative glutathione S-transferase [Natrialbaceae archaeon]